MSLISSEHMPQRAAGRLREPVPGRRCDPATTIDRLFVRWHDDHDRQAREALFERFLPLARGLAHRYHNPHEPLEDLIQVAGVGLLYAIDRFDPDRGIHFSSFAIPTIIGELKRHFRNTAWAVHVSRGSQELALRVEHAVRELSDRGRRPPGPAEIAEFLEIDVADVLIGLDAGSAHFSVSLDAPATKSDVPEPQLLGESFGCDEEGYDLVDVTLSLATAIVRLPCREQTVLRLRTERDLKQSEIADTIGCSQMQVSRLLRAATERLRQQIEP